jgi:uncharacterized damage-inducible protein DinB
MNDLVYDALRIRILKVFPAQIRAAVAPLSEEQFWWRPNESTNSVGNIVIHLTGSINHFLNHNLGGLDYKRDRPAEFAERRQIPKAEVLAAFDAMIANAERTLDSLTPARLTDPSPEPKLNANVFEDLLGIAVHLSNHAGQLVWIAKMLREGSMDEVWIKTHRSEGAWK